MLRRTKVDVLTDILLILILGLLSITWFRGNNLIAGGDFGLPLDWIRLFKQCFSAWGETVSFGLFLPQGVFLVLALFNSGLQFLGFGPVLIQKIFFYLCFTGSGLAMYCLCQTFKMPRIGRIASSIFYMLNPFSLVIIWKVSHGSIQIPYAIAPLFLSLFVWAVNSQVKISKLILVFWVFSFFAGIAYANPKFIFIHALPVFFYFLSIQLFDDKKRKRTLTVSLIFLIVWFLANFYWLYPYVSNLGGITRGAHFPVLMSDLEEIRLNSVSLLKAIRMLGYWSLSSGYKGEAYYPYWKFYTFPLVNLISWLIPLLVCLGFFWGKTNKQKLFFFLGVIIFGLWGIKGPLPPLGGLISWIYARIPYFSLPARFSFLFYGLPTYLVFSLLLGYGFLFLYELGYRQIKKWVLLPLFSLFLLLTVVLVWPFWNGEVVRAEGKVFPGERFWVPDYWWQAKEWLSGQRDYFRVLPLPMSKTYNVAFHWGEGYSGTDISRWLLPQPYIYSNSGNTYRIPELIGSLIEKQSDFKEIAKLLGLINTKYLLLRDDTRWEFFLGHNWWFIHNEDNLKSFLSKQKDLSVDREIGKLKFYKIDNDYLLPHIYIPRQVTYAMGDVDGLAAMTEFFDPQNKEAIYFSGQDGDKLPFDPQAFNQLLIWQKPVFSGNGAPNYLVNPTYKFEIPVAGDYELYLPREISGKYYVLPENQIELTLDGENRQKARLGSQANNLFKLGHFTLEKGFHEITLFSPPAVNLVADPSFENKPWDSVEILSSAKLGGEASSSLSSDAKEGRYSLKLTAGRNTMITFSPVDHFRIGDTYNVSFWAKNLEGKPPVIVIWQNQDQAKTPHWSPSINQFGSADPLTSFSRVPLLLSKEWKQYHFSFKPHETMQMFGLAFMGEGGEKSNNLYDDVHVERVFDSPILLRYVSPLSSPKPPEVSFAKRNSTSYQINVRDAKGPFFLVFSDAFSPEWGLSIPGKHFFVNGFANGWHISKTGDYQITLEYQNQKKLVFSYGVTLASFVFFLAYSLVTIKH
jgi:hypothetical protein